MQGEREIKGIEQEVMHVSDGEVLMRADPLHP